MENKQTGTFIAQLRKENNLTQKELAEKINVTDKAISRWETGKGFPEVSLLIPLCNTLGVSVNELLTGERIEVNKIIDNSDKVIVDTIKTSNKKVNKLNKLIVVLFIFFEVLVFYYVPSTASPSDTMGVIFFSVLANMILSFCVGFIDAKIKYLMPFFVVAIFIPTVFFTDFFSYFDGEEVAVYTIVYYISSLVPILISSLLDFVIKKIIAYIAKRKKA